MTEKWTCPRCSNENEPWAVGCASCGSVRPDLSVAGRPPDPEPPTTPSVDASAPDAAQAPVPGSAGLDQPSAPPAAQPMTSWGPAPTPALPPDELAAINSTAAGDEGVPPPVAKAPLWKRLPLGWIVVGVLVAAGAVGGLIFNASRGESGEITKSGDLAAEELRAGDCFDLQDPEAEELEKVTGLPCSSEHEYETFFVGTMAEGAFPTEEGFLEWIDANCVPAFNEYVGLAYDASELDFTWLQPTSEAWNDGDRSMQCVLFHPRIHRLTESLKGSAQ